MRKALIKTLRTKADKLFSQVCFKKWGNKCICGKPATATHHFIPKSISAYLRYNVLNGVPLCYYCHIIRIHSQGDPRIFEEIIKKRGQKWYKELKRLKVVGEKKKSFTTTKYYKQIIKEFEEELEL